MDKKNVSIFKEKLDRERLLVEEQLKKFATKDKEMAGDWDTKFPKMDSNVSGSSGLETAADEVEAYSALLPVEHSLELRLQNVNNALERIKKGTYGICQNCKKEIPIARLQVSPESSLCLECENKK